MNKKLKLIPLALLGVSALAGCGNGDETIYIYTAHEQNRIDLFQSELNKKFPDYKIEVVSIGTDALFGELDANGANSQCDIFVGIEITNAEGLLLKNPDIFADLSDYDTSCYLDEVLAYQNDYTLADGTVRKGHKKYHIQDREAGCILYSKSKLQSLGLSVPTSYNDLLDAKYKGMITMPKTSKGTGYYFYNGYVSEHGKDAAIDYFKQLKTSGNIYSFTGSEEASNLVGGTVAVALGMHFYSQTLVNKNDDLGITYFAEGSPNTYYTMGMLNGREKNEKIKEVYDYFYSYVNYLDNAKMVPEKIYKNNTNKVEIANWEYPNKYTDMHGLLDYNYKKDLLDTWGREIPA